jgi:hypothetical protein
MTDYTVKEYKFKMQQNLLCTEVKMVEQSLHRAGETLKILGGWGFQISRESAQDIGKVVCATHRPLVPSVNIPGTHFC